MLWNLDLKKFQYLSGKANWASWLTATEARNNFGNFILSNLTQNDGLKMILGGKKSENDLLENHHFRLHFLSNCWEKVI